MQMVMGEFCEDINDALKAAVMALGGFKRFGPVMRPELPPDQAAGWLRDCLNRGRREKLDPEQVALILREARKVGFHGAMDFLAYDTGYKAEPVDHEAQVTSLEETIAQGVQLLNAQLAQLNRLKERKSA